VTTKETESAGISPLAERRAMSKINTFQYYRIKDFMWAPPPKHMEDYMSTKLAFPTIK